MLSATGPAYRLRLGGGAAAPLGWPRTPATTQLLAFAPGTPARLLWLTHTEARAIDLASGRETPDGFPFPFPAATITRGSYGTSLGPGDIVVAQPSGGVRRLWTLGKSGVAND